MTAPCAGLHELFDSGYADEHRRARMLCADCILAPACREDAERQARECIGQVPHGTWGGMRWMYGRLAPVRGTP